MGRPQGGRQPAEQLAIRYGHARLVLRQNKWPVSTSIISCRDQPDLNWWDQRVHDEFDRILRYWFDRGVAGFRIDVAHGLYKDALLRDNPPAEPTDHPAIKRAGPPPRLQLEPTRSARRLPALAANSRQLIRRGGRCSERHGSSTSNVSAITTAGGSQSCIWPSISCS